MADFESNNQVMADLENNNQEKMEDDFCLPEGSDDLEWDADDSFYQVCFWGFFTLVLRLRTCQ